MKGKKLHSFKLTLAVVAAALCGVSASFGGIVYSQLTTTGLNASFATNPDALDDVGFATGSTLLQQKLSALNFGYGVAVGTAAQTVGVTVLFYDTINTASTGAVESASLGGFSGTLNITANTGTATSFRSTGFTGLTGLTTPILFNDDNIGVEIYFTNAAGTAYSTVVSPLMTAGVPTVGTSVLGVYRDTSGDGDFQASEFNPALGNLYLSITTVNAVPEPGTWALLALGSVGGLLAWRKRAVRA